MGKTSNKKSVAIQTSILDNESLLLSLKDTIGMEKEF